MFFDIETSPNIGYFWRPGRKVSIDYDNIITERKIICICWKYLGYDDIYDLTWEKKNNGFCDKNMLKEFIKEINDAHIVVGHNGDAFDVRWIKGRALQLGLDPITNVHSLDTFKLARFNFNLNSYRLDYIAKYLGLGAKVSTGGFDLWKRVMDGDDDALEEMVHYCRNDTVLLEDIFVKIAPYVDNFPKTNMSFIMNGDREGCTKCGSYNILKHGHRYTIAGKKRRWMCAECRHSWTDTRLLKN